MRLQIERGGDNGRRERKKGGRKLGAPEEKAKGESESERGEGPETKKLVGWVSRRNNGECKVGLGGGDWN